MGQHNDTLICAICGTTGFKSSQIMEDPISPTALREVLRSNVPPPAKWEATLRDVIQKAPAELERYDAEIRKLQVLLSGLVSERAALSSHSDACRSVFSPIRRLPVELLTKIFGICASYEKDIDRPASVTTPAKEMDRLAKRPLLELSQVCSHWHEVAIGTPHLWSTIVVNTGNWQQSSLPTSLSLLASCLNRSRDSPLKIRICGTAGDPGALYASELLCQHAQRWKDGHFGIHRGLQYLASAKGNLPLLKTLLYSPHIEVVDIFEVAPVLTEVLFVGQPECVGKLPWSQIQKFTYSGGNTMSPAFSPFAQSVAAGTTFTFTPILPVDLSLQPRAVVSNMETLVVILGLRPSQSNENARLGQILDSLTVPQLRRFRLTPTKHDAHELPAWSSEHFLAFSQRSSLHTHLVSLQIGAHITDEELLQCLSGLPLLEELTIQSEVRSGDVFVTDALLDSLTRKPDVPPLIPELRFFSLSSVLRFADTAFCNFVSSRMGPGRKDNRPFELALRGLRHPRRASPMALVERLLEFQSQGNLKLKLGA
ncbi:hypothetical protein DFH06DRAFT_1293331 [Mycena polygramma]|nr:hypothetical protein DFH06DRAFT_1293331 [Mycena polygramma]